MKTRRFISMLLTVAVMLSLSVTAFATGPHNTNGSPADFALEQIAAIDSNDVACPWSDETSIEDTIILYDMDQMPNGYIFKLKTDAEESGFIQIHDIEGTYSLYCYAYGGDSEVECMVDYWNIDLGEDTHIYFLGNFKYLIDGDDDEYLDLASNTCVNYAKNELAAIENNYATRIKETPFALEKNAVATTSSYVVPLGSDDDYYWPVMSDFSGQTITYNGKTQTVTNHCTPTAATGIVRYLKHLGRTQCSTGETTYQTFEKMYIALNTNEIRFNGLFSGDEGTARSQIVTGINYYATQNGYSLTVAKPLLVTLSSMKSHLDNKRLLLISVDDFSGTSGGHSIVATGYSNDTLHIQNGWSRNQMSYAYTSLDIAQYVYVGG